MVSEVITLLLGISAKMGYWGVVFLMAIESSFIPFPSEIVVPPAAYLASQGEMNILLVIVAGIVGSLIGASANYFLALTLGRKIIYSLANNGLARIFLITEDKIKIAEKYFIDYGRISTFLGRLVPAVRQLISIPAGFSKMHFGAFIFYTFLGSGLWTVILAVLGYSFGANQELLKSYYREISYFFVGVFILILFFIFHKTRKKKKEH